jgi:hypothetical protein
MIINEIQAKSILSKSQVCTYTVNHYADAVFKRYGMHWALKGTYFQEKGAELQAGFAEAGIPCRKLF